jgi:hypothetical protein
MRIVCSFCGVRKDATSENSLCSMPLSHGTHGWMEEGSDPAAITQRESQARVNNETTGGYKTLIVLAFLAWGLIYTRGCGYSWSPAMIVADGETFISCDGAHVSSDGTWGGEQVYTVSFSQAGVGSVTIRGVHKLTVTDAPKDTCSDKPKQ